MLIACWSSKGGSGTTVVASCLALVLSRVGTDSVVLADLGGDVPTVLGIADPEPPGLAEWVTAGEGVPDDALDRLEHDLAPRLSLLGAGTRGDPVPGTDDRGAALAAALARRDGVAVVDCGSRPGPLGMAVAAAADLSLLVLRPCFLAVRRALDAPIRPTGVVIVLEPGRSLTPTDISHALDVPVRAVLPWDAAVARAVDAGVLASRVPRVIERALRRAA